MSNGGDNSGQIGTNPPKQTDIKASLPSAGLSSGDANQAGMGLAGLLGGANSNYVPGYSKFDPVKDAQYKAQQTAQQPYTAPTTGDPNTNTVNNQPGASPVAPAGQSGFGQQNFQNQLMLGRMNLMQQQGLQPPAAGGPGGKPGGLPQQQLQQGGMQGPLFQNQYNTYAAGGEIRPRAHHAHMAHGLASLGRGEDSVLVHMTPHEVGGLQSLARATGGSLTTNPSTGLPEAGWLSSVLPMVAGGVLAATGVGAPAAAAIVAAEEGIRQKDWKKGLMAGLGAYGGAGLGSAFTGAGEAAGGAAAGEAGKAAATKAAETAASSGTEALAAAPSSVAGNVAEAAGNAAGFTAPTAESLGATQAASPLMQSAAAYTPAATAGAAMPSAAIGAPTFSENMSNMGRGIAGLTQKGGMDAVAKQGIGRGTLAMAAAPALYSAAYPDQPKMPPPTANEYYLPAPGQKSLYNPGTINPNIAKLGYLPAGQAAITGQGWNPGVWSSTYPYNTAPTSPYGGNGMINNLLNNLYNQQAGQGRASGGLLSGPGDGVSDSIPGMIDGQHPAAMATGEFVVPARIVSELGNGSTDSGAARLHDMMRRVEAGRKKVSVAGDSKAYRKLPV